MKLKKDKSYSIRQNEELVNLVKEETGKSIQKIVDEALAKYQHLVVEETCEDSDIGDL